MTVMAYQYDADRHCVRCAFERFGDEDAPADTTDGNYIPFEATDSEGNTVSRIDRYDAWCEDYECEGTTLDCGTCGRFIAECGHEPPTCRVCDCYCERESVNDGRGCPCEERLCRSCSCEPEYSDDCSCESCDATEEHADERAASEAPTALEWVVQVTEMMRPHQRRAVRS